MPQQQTSKRHSGEADIQLALQALKQDANLRLKRAADIYKVSRSTLRGRHAGVSFRRDTTPNLMRLRPTEEEEIVRCILELDA